MQRRGGGGNCLVCARGRGGQYLMVRIQIQSLFADGQETHQVLPLLLVSIFRVHFEQAVVALRWRGEHPSN